MAGMEIVVDVYKLRGILKDNMEKHVTFYKKAIAGYRRKAADELTKALKKFNQVLDKLEAGEPVKVPSYRVSMAVPESHEEDYKRAIAMLDIHNAEEIALSTSEYRNLVDDQWGWTAHTMNTWAGYMMDPIDVASLGITPQDLAEDD